jgi:DNA-binding NarL/FixJ family response regulator
MQPEANETNVRPLRPEPGTAGAVWVECPYPLVTLGLQQTLQAAGHDVSRSGRKGSTVAAEQEQGEAPSCCVVYCPTYEDVVGWVEHLRRLFPGAPVLVMGFGVDLPLARAAARGGARGFLHLGMQPSQIAHAISLASEGETVFPRELVTGLISEEEPPDVLVLTARQREILELVAHGLTNAEIARKLFLTEGTVKQHLRAAYKALGVGSRVQAARILGNRGVPS